MNPDGSPDIQDEVLTHVRSSSNGVCPRMSISMEKRNPFRLSEKSSVDLFKTSNVFSGDHENKDVFLS